MGALKYLYFTRLKNRLIQMVKKPASLIFMLFIVAMLVLTIVSGFMSDGEGGYERMPIAYLVAGLTLLYSVIFIMTAAKGLGVGASIFTLSDVNYIFSSPTKPQNVLFYGLVQQVGASLLLGFFLLFQFAWLHQMFGISFPQLLLIVAGYACATFCGQLAAMAMYSLTVNSEPAQKVMKAVFYTVPALFGLWLFANVLAGGLDAPLDRAVEIVNGPVVRWFPVGGWLGMFAGGAITGDWVVSLVGLGVTLVAAAGVVVIMVMADLDYYEDVLQTAETSYSAIAAAKEGSVAEAGPKVVKLGKTGLGGGWGASAFYYEHRLENRRSRTFLLSGQQLTFVAVSVAMAFFLKDGGLVGVFAFATYMQIFSVAMGRFNRELVKPYVYLVPEPSFQKLLQCMREALPGAVTEAVLIFVPAGLIMEAPMTAVAAFIVARVAAAALINAGNLLVERLFSSIDSKALSLMLYFVVVIAVFVPPVAAGLVVGGLLATPAMMETSGALVFAIVAVLEAALLAFLCRDTLEVAELNNQ